MDFDHSLDKITPDVTTQLSIGGAGAIVIPSGNTASRPGSATVGALRWNTDTPGTEVYNGTGWVAVTVGSNNITVGTTAPSSPAVGDIWVDTN